MEVSGWLYGGRGDVHREAVFHDVLPHHFIKFACTIWIRLLAKSWELDT